MEQTTVQKEIKGMYGTINLDDCTEITALEYMELENPQFRGQTRLDKDNGYTMVWECQGKMYKTYQTL